MPLTGHVRVLALAAVMFGTVVSGIAPASAAQEKSCGPQISISGTTLVDRFDTAPDKLGSAGVYLTIARKPGWSELIAYGSVITSFGGSYRIWMDWSDSPGTWKQCGPFSIDGSQGTNRHTWAINHWRSPAGHDRYFRACGDLGAGQGGAPVCTDWYHAL
jgi:hypothetical protein